MSFLTNCQEGKFAEFVSSNKEQTSEWKAYGKERRLLCSL